jgi:hypothetical protein
MSHARAMRAAIAGLVLITSAAACGKKHEAPPPPPPVKPPAPKVPVAPPALAVLPIAITLDEIKAHAPTVTGLRMTAELTVDASGKQATGAGCVPATGAKVAMHQVADAFGVARWDLKVRETTKGDAQGEFIADLMVAGGMLHARGVLTARPPCAAGEIGLDLFYSKLAKAPKPAPPPPQAPPAAPLDR